MIWRAASRTPPLLNGVINVASIGTEHRDLGDNIRSWQAELAQEPEPVSPVTLHPAAIESYRRSLKDLRKVIERNPKSADAYSRLMRQLIKEVRVRTWRSASPISNSLES
jgi:ribonuclease D